MSLLANRPMRLLTTALALLGLAGCFGEGDGPQSIPGTPQPPLIGLLVDALHRMSESSGVDYDPKQRRAAIRASEAVAQAIESGEPENARAVSEKMLAAALRYWERTVPDLLKRPVAWIDSDH